MTTVTLAGGGNGHSHAFHRALRGRTHRDGGDFWAWREAMYRVAAVLDPELYGRLAEAVFAEMLVSGYTAVGEFHYVHHRPDGGAYRDPNAIGRSLAAAAERVGIRLTLLDTCYLAGGPGRALEPIQARFCDGSAAAWLERWHALADATSDRVLIGAAIHSVRAVPPPAIAEIVAGIPPEVPLHVHLSEQPAENAAVMEAYGRTPTQVLADAGALTARLSVVHATHLTEEDIQLLGAAGVTAVLCPTTEADLGDGIGPARELADAGAVIALGSDQNTVIDPFLEMRGLEAGERLRSLARGRFSPSELDAARSTGGYRALGWADALDTLEVDADSVRTVGASFDQVTLAATASDVLRVLVGGELVAERGRLADGRDPAKLLAAALSELDVLTGYVR
ncbi:formimidoylglutamate deiminase [Gryllotalpicola sp.]|uniref:formimidoylglutamate deiminase n=1 Tax=Gryllotalpicola sp. TaxID=1932787 RepID=UPI0026132764|nr:formimidoylglutamate deiminase [Gryllotalpicola sp.]